MEHKKAFLKPKWSFVILLIIYFISGVFLIKYYKYEGLHSDAIAYFSIAQKYADGNFSDAVNGFWSPLLPWLLAPFLKFGFSFLSSARIINLAAGIFLLSGIRELLSSFDINDRLRKLILFSSIPIVLSYTVLIFPDLLLLSILVWYLCFIFDTEYPAKKYTGLICGALGAVAYFSKNYAFPFFLSHFVLMNVIFYFNRGSKVEKKNVLINTVTGLIFFFIISGIWVFQISSKYDHFTIGTAGNYNFSQIGPDLPQMADQPEPVLYKGLMAPANSSAISVMEDPTYIEVDSWSLFQSRENLFHFTQHVIKNIVNIMRILHGFSVFSILIIIMSLSLVIFYFRRGELGIEFIFPLVTLFLYSAGYTPFIINENNIRYLWVDNILLLLISGQVLTILFKQNILKSDTGKNIVVFLLFLSFITPPILDVIRKPTRGEKNFKLYNSITLKNALQGNIASNDRWGDVLQIVFYLNLLNNNTRYFGMPKKDQGDKELLRELTDYNIDYYFVWGESDFLPDYNEITAGEIPGLKIFYVAGVE